MGIARPINPPLGLTVYCWRVRLHSPAIRELKCHASTVQPCRFCRALARLLSSAAVTAVLAAGLGGCQTMSDMTGALTSSSKGASRSRRSAPRGRGLRRAISRQSQGCRGGIGLRPGAARHRPARAGRRRARTGHHRPSRQQGAARRLRPRARRQRQFAGGLRRAQPRPFARQSRLAHSFGAGHHARQARQARGGPPLLRRPR